MKKSYLFSAFAAGMVMLSACSSDGDLTGGNADNESNDAVQQIVLQVANTGEGMQTRAGRPLLSSEAKQDIKFVKVIICDESKQIVKEKTYSNWNGADKTTKSDSKDYSTGGAHGREVTLEYKGTEKLNDGKYKVYAFGYSEGSDYKDLDTKMSQLVVGETFTPNITLSLKNETVKGEEIFAGCSNEITINETNKGFNETVVLNRQVAGTFGYFDNIPYVAGATTLQLVASQRNNDLVLGSFNSFDLTGNGVNNDGHVNYVVNGTNTASDKVVYTINLKDWFGRIEDTDHNGLIDATNWTKPTSYANANFKNGSVFGGSFLIPFAKVNGEKTFVLQLTNGTDVLKEWTVKLPSTDGQVNRTHTLFTWNGTNFTSKTGVKDDQNTYNVVRNHLYGIGTRSLDKPIDPENPDPDKPDNPEPLNKKQELTLRVNDNWEVIHKMELE